MYDEKWEQAFLLLQDFVKEHGRFPTARESYQGVNIGRWFVYQRNKMQSSTLPPEQQEKLDALKQGDFTSPPLQSQWDKTYQLLEAFVAEYHRLPKARESYRGVSIGRWYIYQKQQALSPAYPTQKLDKLEKLKGFEPVKPAPARTDSPVYSEVRPREPKPAPPKPRANWQENYQILRQFISEYGRLPKARESYQGIRIGNWCAAQKQAVKKPDFPADRRVLLEEVGLFDDQIDLTWMEKFHLLEEFAALHHRFPTAREDYRDVHLGRWYSDQKQKSKKPNYPKKQLELLNGITLDRSDKLEESGPVEVPLNSKWAEKFRLVEAFILEHKRLPNSREIYQGVQIGRWFFFQKQKAKEPNYPKKQLELLDSIQHVDKKPSSKWDENYANLKEYIAAHNRIPEAKEIYKGFRLGRWCSAQKYLAQNPDFPADRRAKLDAVGLFEEHPDPRWARTFRLLKQYISEHGCFPMSEEEYHGVRLGRWCYVQKQKATKFTDYPSKQRELLKDIGLLE